MKISIKLIMFILAAGHFSACAPASVARFANESSRDSKTMTDPSNFQVDLAPEASRQPATTGASARASTSTPPAPADPATPDIIITGHLPPTQPRTVPHVALAQATRVAHSSPLPANELPVPAWAASSHSEMWTKLTMKAIEDLGSKLIQTDILDAQDFCPAYKSLLTLEREKVWVQLISSIAKFESDFNPISAFTESFRGTDNKLVVSRGLLQISKGSANSYGCHIVSERQLEDPETNLRCGVRIISSLVSKDQAIRGLGSVDVSSAPWMGAARYWSVLRRNTKDLLIRASVRQMSICKA